MTTTAGLLVVLGAFWSAVSLTGAIQVCPNLDFKIYQNGYCYSFHTNEYANNGLARQRCKEMSTTMGNVDLVSIHSADENKFINDQMKAKKYTNYWIGFDRKPGTDNFQWSDGSKVNYKNWAPGEPNNGNNNEDCTEVKYGTPQWNDMPCTSYMYGYVCMTKAVDGWQREGEQEYYIMTTKGDKSLDWYGAQAWCNENSGELASVHSDDDVAIIYKWLKLIGSSGNFWVGLNKLYKDRTEWKWSDGTAYDYNNWEYGHPKPGSYDLCSAIKGNDEKGKWHEAHCNDDNHGYICKRKFGDNEIKTPQPPVTGSGYCRKDFTEAGNKCFYVDARQEHNGLSWREAVDHCQRFTGYLSDIASINNPLEQAVVDSLLQKSSHALWIGYYRTSTGSRTWKWRDNSRDTFTNWGPGEPLFSDFHCTTVRPYAAPLGTWGNWDCDLKQGVICQVMKSPDQVISTPPVTTPNKCSSGYMPFWYGCYKVVTETKTWTAARQACRDDGADLVSIHHGAENGFIQSLALSKDASVWIGLNDEDKKGEYSWSDGWALIYTKWGMDEPDQDPTNGGCVKMQPNFGAWEDSFCNDPAAFVCKKTDAEKITTPAVREGTCPSRYGWVTHGSYCYRTVNDQKTWQNAQAHCFTLGLGSTLVSLHSVEENQWLYKILTLDGLLTNHMWIGLYKQSNTGGLAWSDLSPVGYENWAPGEPDGVLGQQNCVSYHKNYPGQWQDQPCDTLQGSICKAPKIQYPTLPTAAPGICPDSWVSAGASCYLFVPNRGLEWINARMECKRLSQDFVEDADLVTIKSAAEDAFVNTEMFFRKDNIESSGNFWLGMAKAKSGAPYLWVDLTNPEDIYKNWQHDQPDASEDGSENCVDQDMGSGKWADTKCTEIRGFACQMDKLPSTETVPRPGAGDSGLNGGQVAGIVIGVLALVAIIGGIVFYLVRNNTIDNPIDKVRGMAAGFSNPFYSSRDDTQRTMADEAAA